MITPILSNEPSPVAALCGIRLGEVSIDALPLPFDVGAWSERFAKQWAPEGPAHASFF